jgi:hypothetical protein
MIIRLYQGVENYFARDEHHCKKFFLLGFVYGTCSGRVPRNGLESDARPTATACQVHFRQFRDLRLIPFRTFHFP